MIMRKITFISLLFVLFWVACHKLTPEEQAILRIQNVRSLIANNQLNQAKMELDSVHVLFRTEVAQRRVAQHLSDSITYIESQRTLRYCDSILILKNEEKAKLRKQFRFEKNDNYETEGSYVFYLLRTESNAERCFLQARITESSELILKSTYCGTFPIEHTHAILSNNESSVSGAEISISDAANHSFSDGGKTWEMLHYKNEDALRLLNFISENEENRIKVTLQGKRKYTYTLMQSEKKALEATYHFAVVMRDVAQLEKEIEKANFQIKRFDEKNNKVNL